MDIHGPVGPTRSLKDFAVHIGIVTIGIIIALSLEGIRETVYVHRAVREARENFRVEMTENQRNIRLELENARGMQAQIQKIVADLPELRQHPEQFASRISMIKPSFYFFSSSRWDSALSTGALGHMKLRKSITMLLRTSSCMTIVLWRRRHPLLGSASRLSLPLDRRSRHRISRAESKSCWSSKVTSRQ
jgi:hypothetical protein